MSENSLATPAGSGGAFEVGIYSFAELTPDLVTGEKLSPAQRLRNLVESIELADQVGLDVFGLGEHHRPEYVSSTPAVILAAIAARTQRIGSAVPSPCSVPTTRCASSRSIATLDLLSNGRAEIMAGRGSFIESFPLFGYDLQRLQRAICRKSWICCCGCDAGSVSPGREGIRPALNDLGVYPRPVQNPLPVWIAVGGTPESVVRAATLGLPMALAIIGGMPERFVPMVDLYRDAARRAGHDPADSAGQHQLPRLDRRRLATGSQRLLPLLRQRR